MKRPTPRMLGESFVRILGQKKYEEERARTGNLNMFRRAVRQETPEFFATLVDHAAQAREEAVS